MNTGTKSKEPDPDGPPLVASTVAHIVGIVEPLVVDHVNGNFSDENDPEQAQDEDEAEKKEQYKSSQKKRADYAAFDTFLEQNRESIVAKSLQNALVTKGETTASMFRDFASKKIIENPRDYQVELFERAKEKNIIAVLDTGK
jgi:endoribonuclease Dicer